MTYQTPAPQSPPPKIDTWLWQSIVCTLCCCLPLGIVGIVFAAQAGSKQSSGDYAGAQEAAAKAKQFTLIGIGVGLVVNIIVAIIQFATISASLHR